MKPTMARLIPLIATILLPASMVAAGVVIDMPPAPAQPQPAETQDEPSMEAEDAAPPDQADVGEVALWRFAAVRTGPRDLSYPPVNPYGYYNTYDYYHGYAYRSWYGWPSVGWCGWGPPALRYPGLRIARISWTLR